MSIVYVSRITITCDTDQFSDFAENYQSLMTRFLCAPRTRVALEEDAVEFISFDKNSKAISVDAPHVRGDSFKQYEQFLSDPYLKEYVLDNIYDNTQSDNSYFFIVGTRYWDFFPAINYFSHYFPQLLFQHWIYAECEDGYYIYIMRYGIVLEYLHYLLVPDIPADKPQVQIEWRYHVPHFEDFLNIKVMGINGKEQ